MSKYSILAVDDDPNLLAALRRQLGRRFDMATATSGAEAVECVLAAEQAGESYAVVICDMCMPGMNGLETLAAIRAIAPRTSRIMLTGNADQQTAVDAINRGNIFRFFTKPCPPETLAAAVTEGAEEYHRVTARDAEMARVTHVAAHDLQEPLRTIASYVQLLRRRFADRLDPDAEEFIDLAVEGTHRMQRLLCDFLAYLEIEGGRGPVAPVPMEALLEKATRRLAAPIVASGARVSHGALPTVEGDEGLLLILFEQLIDNAIKYRRDHPPEIHVDAVQANGQWTFSVRDNGLGIEGAYARQIFELFERLHPIGDFDGTGVGLALCRKIVEYHHGRIWVESNPGQGATFLFTLGMPAPRHS